MDVYHFTFKLLRFLSLMLLLAVTNDNKSGSLSPHNATDWTELNYSPKRQESLEVEDRCLKSQLNVHSGFQIFEEALFIDFVFYKTVLILLEISIIIILIY